MRDFRKYAILPLLVFGGLLFAGVLHSDEHAECEHHAPEQCLLAKALSLGALEPASLHVETHAPASELTVFSEVEPLAGIFIDRPFSRGPPSVS